MDQLPVFRREEIPPGLLYALTESRLVDLTTGETETLRPGYYVHAADPRSDDEIRHAVVVSGTGSASGTASGAGT